MKNLYYKFPENIFSRITAKIFQETIFREIISWPSKGFPWTQKKITFCLSFDCDTDKDTEALPGILDLLDKYGIKSSFAVCGQMVEESPDIYRALIEGGHEIMNHGYSRHAEIKEGGEVVSTLFYDDLDMENIENEICKNHQAIEAVLSYKMTGFRIPHFGVFQEKEKMESLYKVLQRLNYSYDSSALMVFAKQNGLLNYNEITSFPLTPVPGTLLSVLDTWSFINSPKRKKEDFFFYFKKILDYASRAGKPTFINIYMDPRHILEFEGFRKSLSYFQVFKEYVYNDSYRNLVEKSIPVI